MDTSWKTIKRKNRHILCILCIGLLAMFGNGRAMATSPTSLGKVGTQQTDRKVEGVVVDKAGIPLVGVTVKVKGTNMTVITDIDGHFSVLAPSSSTLEISYIGFKPVEIPASRENIRIVMEEDSILMDEVVVIGYGAQKKAHLTAAVASVNVEETLSSRPIADVGRGLQGAVAGLNVRIPSGELGSDPLMSIRGNVGSVLGSNKPLILVDNVEVPSIQLINPDDVAEISVLKDAAASSIYGAKAAFGVILITTKKGSKSGNIEVNYSGNFAWKNSFKDIELGGLEGLQYTLDGWRNMKQTSPAGGFWRLDENSIQRSKEWIEKYGGTVGSSDPILYGRDWYYQDGQKFGVRLYDPIEHMVAEWQPSHDHNVSVAGKSNNTTYNISFGYLSQQGLMKPAKDDDFKRYTGTVKVSTDINKYITVRAGAMFSDRNKRYPGASNSYNVADPWFYTYRWSQLFPTGVEQNGMEVRSPVFETRTAPTSNQRNRYTNINIGTTLNFTDNWNLMADYTFVSRDDHTNAAYPSYTAPTHWYGVIPSLDADGNQIYVNEEGIQVPAGEGEMAYEFPVSEYIPQSSSYVSRSQRTSNEHAFNAYTTYSFLDASQRHAAKAMLGTNITASDNKYSYAQRMGLIDNEPYFNKATGEQFGSGTAYWESQAGFFGRLNYAFEDKYLVEANLRYDGSSKFSKNLRWRWYPSFSGGWVLSNEKFMEPLKPIWSFGKIRASWGSVGDQSVSNSLYLPVMTGAYGNWLSGATDQFYEIRRPNPISDGIGWQKIETLDVGFDFRFIKDKLGVSFDWYQRDTKDMIIRGDALPPTYGDQAAYGNHGNLRTKGFELTVDFNHQFDFGLNVNLQGTFADAITNVTKGPDYMTPDGSRTLTDTWRTGSRYGDIYGYVTDRLYQKDDFVYDENGAIKQVYIIHNGTRKLTNMLAGENPVYQVFFEDGGQVLLTSPGDVKYVDVNGDGYISSGSNTVEDPGDRVVIGNTLPRYEYGLRVNADFKGFDLSLFFHGVGKREVWGNGTLAIPGFGSKEGGMPKAFATNYWTEERTDAFYPRAWNYERSNTGWNIQRQTAYLLDMSYFKLKNITFGYSVPENILRKAFMKKARLYISLENFFTKDNLRDLPIDPESIAGHSMFSSNYNQGHLGTGTPTFKTASFGIQLTF